LGNRLGSPGRGIRFVLVKDQMDTRKVRWGRRCKGSFEVLSGHRCDIRLDHPNLHAEGAGCPGWRFQKVTGLERHSRRDPDRTVFPCGRTKDSSP
jgi:hypothetical protein